MRKIFYLDSDIIAEVRDNREKLLASFGGIEGLHKHMDEERPLLEQDGWKFVDLDDMLAKKQPRNGLNSDVA